MGRPKKQRGTPKAHTKSQRKRRRVRQQQQQASPPPATTRPTQSDVPPHTTLRERRDSAVRLIRLLHRAGEMARLIFIITTLEFLLNLPEPIPITLRGAAVALGYTWRRLKHIRLFVQHGTLAPETRGGARNSLSLLGVFDVRDECLERWVALCQATTLKTTRRRCTAFVPK